MSLVLRKAIWGIYGIEESKSYIEWNKHNSCMKISDKLIDSRYMIVVSAKIKYSYIETPSTKDGLENEEEHWKYERDLEVSLPFIIGLSKEDFSEDCLMRYDSKYRYLYEPTEEDIPKYSFENDIKISDIKITLVHNKKKNLLDLTWEEDSYLGKTDSRHPSLFDGVSKVILVHKDKEKLLELISKN